jgi:hypothetical protein
MSRHALNLYHPALARLLRDKTKASLRRVTRRLSSRRRFVLSCLAVVLSLIWMGNAALCILFRESADPASLRHWIPLGLLSYALWHLVKVGYRRPEQSIEWSAAEREILGMAPFSRGQLLTYRLTSVFGASVMKAACFALLMMPDLPRPALGFVGILLALLMIELWRMAVEITACGVSQTTYHKLRFADLTCVATACASALVIACCTPVAPTGGGWPSPLLLPMHLGQAAVRLVETPMGQLFLAPFYPFAAVILAEDVSGGLLLHGLVAVTLVVAMVGVLAAADRYFGQRCVQRERHAYARRPVRVAPVAGGPTSLRQLPSLPWQAGWLALAWRQALGARHYWGSVVIAMAVPTFLALTPLLVHTSRSATLLTVIGSAAFYSLLLLPAAFRFDFRRDVDHMALLKSLPVAPTAMVAGQLLVPIALTSGFQLLVLSIAAARQPADLLYVAVAWLVLVPMNVLVFALDNLLFLLYPHRLNQEGFEIFLRTTLTFTAKGLLFALGLAMTAGWALSAASLAKWLARGDDPLPLVGLLFPLGLTCMLTVAAGLAFHLAVQAFRRYDPSQDAPA